MSWLLILGSGYDNGPAGGPGDRGCHGLGPARAARNDPHGRRAAARADRQDISGSSPASAATTALEHGWRSRRASSRAPGQLVAWPLICPPASATAAVGASVDTEPIDGCCIGTWVPSLGDVTARWWPLMLNSMISESARNQGMFRPAERRQNARGAYVQQVGPGGRAIFVLAQKKPHRCEPSHCGFRGLGKNAGPTGASRAPTASAASTSSCTRGPS